MKHLIQYFVENFKVTLTLTLFLCVSGVLGLLTLKRETFPLVDFAQVLISTVYPGSSSQEVDERVTRRIEDELRGVDGLRQVSSVSQSGTSTINVRIDADNVNSDKVVTDLQRAVQRVSGLPSDLLDLPSFMEINTKEIPIVEFALIGSNDGQGRDRLADSIKSQIEDVPGVSKVRLDGYQEREIQIHLDPQKMIQHYVGVSDVIRSVSARLQNIPAGLVTESGNERLIRLRGKLDDFKNFEQIVIRSNFSGEQVRLKDVASIADGSEDARILANADGESATIITVIKKGEADSIRTVDAVKEKMAEIEAHLSEGFRIIRFTDEGTKIKDRLGIVISNTMTGLVLVVIILLIFLPGILGIASAVSLPLCIMGTTALLPFFGITFNTISMLGIIIVIGMLVDNTIVISENYARLRETQDDPKEAAALSAYQFYIPITATALTTIAAFLPMLVTKGIMGQFIRNIPVVVTIALVICILESFFLLPMRLRWTLRKKNVQQEQDEGAKPHRDWWRPVRDFSESVMYRAVKGRYLVFGVLSALLVGSVWFSINYNRFELFPGDSVEVYIARFEMPDGTHLDATNEQGQRLSKELRRIIGPENLRGIVARTGTSYAGPGDIGGGNGPHVGGLVAYIDPDRTPYVKPQNVLEEFRAVDQGPLVKFAIESNSNGPPVGKPINIVLRGNHYPSVRAVADQLSEHLKSIDGVRDIADDDQPASSEYGLRVDYEKMARLGLSNEAVGLALRSALQGVIVSDINIDGKIINVRARYNEESRRSLDAVLSTRVHDGAAGKLVPLSSFARFEKDDGPPILKRFDFKRAVTIAGDVVPEKITSLEANAAAEKFLQDIASKYPDVSYKLGGEQESTNESVQSLFNAMILAFMGIGAILIFVFNSFAKPLLVMSTIPLGLVGVSWAFYFHNRPLSFLALIGVVGLAGVVVNSAIVLVAYIDQLRSEGELSLNRILAKASSDRLRAILATGLTTVCGLLPTAYGIGGYDSFLVPMVLALAWGLVAGTILQLVWVPCAYAIGCDFGKLFGRILRPKARDKKSSINQLTT